MADVRQRVEAMDDDIEMVAWVDPDTADQLRCEINNALGHAEAGRLAEAHAILDVTRTRAHRAIVLAEARLAREPACDGTLNTFWLEPALA